MGFRYGPWLRRLGLQLTGKVEEEEEEGLDGGIVDERAAAGVVACLMGCSLAGHSIESEICRRDELRVESCEPAVRP